MTEFLTNPEIILSISWLFNCLGTGFCILGIGLGFYFFFKGMDL